ncbi:MAG TPA: hypothetical protein VF577_02170 [Allosphingosinicella sp.]
MADFETGRIEVLGLLAAVMLMCGTGGAEEPQARFDYAEGQVWEYRTRPGEEGSRLRIQRIERVGEAASRGPVYHISVSGVRLGPGIAPMLPHAPVARETLDASVTRLAERQELSFSSADPGIAEWRAARGGVFTIPVAEIVATAEQAIARGRGGQ